MSASFYGDIGTFRVQKDLETNMEIERIKATDPERWAQAEFRAAQFLVGDMVTKKRRAEELKKVKDSPTQIKGTSEIATEVWSEIKDFTTLQQLQDYSEQQKITLDASNFEQLAYEAYNSPS